MKAGDTTAEAEKVRLEIFRRMGPEERLRRAVDLSRTCRDLMRAGVKERHPEYDDREVRLAVIRLTLPEELFLSAFPDARDITP